MQSVESCRIEALLTGQLRPDMVVRYQKRVVTLAALSEIDGPPYLTPDYVIWLNYGNPYFDSIYYPGIRDL